jgi:hypothetical protein
MKGQLFIFTQGQKVSLLDYLYGKSPMTDRTSNGRGDRVVRGTIPLPVTR